MPSLNKFLLIGFVIGLSTGIIFVASDVFGATQQIFQAGAGYEITTDSAAQSLDITTKATDGGGVSITTRSTGTGLYVDTSNNIGIGTTAPTAGNKLDVRGNIILGKSGANAISLTNATAGNSLTYIEWVNGSTRQAYMGWTPTYLNLRLENTYNYVIDGGNVGIADTSPTEGTLTVGGTGYFTGTVTVATPTATGHAATKSYVDAAVVNIGAGRVRLETDRNITGVAGDTVAVGSFSNDGIGKNIRVYLKMHTSAVIDVLTFEINEVAYLGASTNWLEVPINQNSVAYAGRAGVALDIYRPNIASTADSLYMRVRNRVGVGAGPVQLVIEYDDDVTFSALSSQSNTATAFNASTAPAGGAVSGYYANVEWNFPVSNGQGWNVSQGGLFVKNDGNVGIGTTSPGYRLDVQGAAYGEGIKFQSTGAIPLYIYGDSGGSGITNADPYSSLVYLTSGNIHFYTSGAGPRMTIDTNGNVGIGTTAPATKLEVTGTNEIARFSGGTSPYITVGNGNTVGTGGYVQYDDTNNKMYISPHALSTITINSSGQVGIGNTGPSYTLDVSGNMRVVSGDNSYTYYGPNATWSGALYVGATPSRVTTATAQVISTDGNLHLDNATSKTMYLNYYSSGDIIMVNAGGNVGIKDTTPTEGTLTVTGTGYFTGTVTVATPTAAGHAATKSYVDSASISAGSNLKSVSTNWGYYVNTGMGGNGAHTITVHVVGNNSEWNGTFAVQGSNSYTPTELWNNAKLMSWQGYNAAVDDVQLLIMSNSTTAQFGSTVLVIKTNAIAAGAAATMTVSVNGTNASALSLTSSLGAPYTYTMTTSANTYQIYQMANGNVGIGTTAPAGKLHLSGAGVFMRLTNTSQAVNMDVGADSTGGYLGTFTNHPVLIYANSSPVVTISGGNVGIGTASPGVKLEVAGSVRGNVSGALRIDTGNGYVDIGPQNTSWAHFQTDRANFYFDKPIYLGTNILSSYNSTLELRGNGTTGVYVKTDGKVYIGNGSYDSGAVLSVGSASVNYPGNSGWAVTWNSNILLSGLDSTSISFHDSGLRVDTLRVAAGTFYIGENVGWGTAGLNVGGSLTVGGSVTVGGGTGKVNAGTIDPIYTIGGKQYATYMAGMTGVKEETTGVLKLNKESGSKNYEYVIDFKNSEEGSDIWLFSKTTNLTKAGLANLAALLTPNFDGRVWYEKDEENLRLVIHGSNDGEVSFRLTAPRFDSDNWPNTSEDPSEGFNLDE